MKRFLLFAFRNMYPEGGADDLAGSYDTKYEAFEALKLQGGESAQILDCETNAISEFACNRYGDNVWKRVSTMMFRAKPLDACNNV